MNQLKKVGYIGYEDLMRELASIEHSLMDENSALAMDLMVLEAKIRDRFQLIQNHSSQNRPDSWGPMDENGFNLDSDWTMEEIQGLIPQDLNPFSDEMDEGRWERKRKFSQTIGWAAFLAVMTALGVFGLASILQVTLNWLA